MSSKRRVLSVSEKIVVLKESESGIKNKDIARKYEIAPSSISTIIRNRDSIIKLYETTGDYKKRSRGCKYDDLDEVVIQWVRMLQDRNIHLTGALIQEKAAEYAKILGHVDFHASSGWLDKFQKRHRIKTKFSSENVKVGDISHWEETRLKSILEEYEPHDIFNADETGIFFKCLPNRTLSFKGNKCSRGENSEERVTVMVSTNMAGTEKLKLLVIGKSKEPECFERVKTLEVDYDYNEKSWITSEIFEKWILSLDTKMRKQGRNIAMIIDNCPAHCPSVASKLNNIKMFYFSPNETSILQPLDQGVIKNLKVHYRKRLLRMLITAHETNQPVTNVINLRTTITVLAKVWEKDVAETTIQNCFAKAGFGKSSILDNGDNNQNDEVPIAVENVWFELQSKGLGPENISLNDYLYLDDGLETTQYPRDDDILNSLLQIKEENVTEEDEEENDVEEDEAENTTM